MTTEIEERILTFIGDDLLGGGAAVGRESNLLSGELLDSVSVLRLATFVADAFHIDVRPADFVIDNFRTVAAISAYVRRRLDESHSGR